MNIGIINLEHAHATRKEKIHRWNNLVIQVVNLSLVIHNVAEPRPDQLPQQAFAVGNRHGGCITSSLFLPDAPITPE